MKMKTKHIVLILMALQVLFICFGIHTILIGELSLGIFNIIFNALFFLMNVDTLNMIKQRDNHENNI